MTGRRGVGWFVFPARANILVVIARWRYELAMGVIAAVAVRGCVDLLGPVWAAVNLGLLVALVASWPTARQYAAALFWWLATPHRLRAGLAGAEIYNLQGKIPYVYRTVQWPWGQEVRVWCRAGTSADDLVRAAADLAAACWAAYVVVIADPGHRQRVTVEVVRHPERR